MRKDSSFELDSSSSCSAASSAGDTPERQDPDSPAPDENAEDIGNISPDCVVPTARTFSTSSRTKSKAHGAANKSSSGASKAKSTKRGQREQLSKEEEERRKIRRERNKIAAAKCRNRRRELIDTLQAETDQLEDEKMLLQTEISDLLKEKEQLEQVLASHKSSCKMSVNDSSAEVPEDCPASPQLMSMLDNTKSSEDMETVPCNPAEAILGNSNILLCSNAQEQSLNVLEGDDLDDLVPSLEMEVMADTAASVPDIDMGTPFCLPDWETLYKSVANDFESLSTPVMSSSPTCSSYNSVFSFNYSEIVSLTEGCESLKGAASDLSKDLHSPTLLAL